MGDKIEVGEYVKTNDGIFGKLLRIERDDIDTSLKWYVLYVPNSPFAKGELYTNKPYIVKHSKYKLELIEQGDYVNGYKVLEIRKHFEVQPYRISIMVYKTKDAEFWKSLEEQDIKDIVTHEQFDSVKYITEEEKKCEK